MAELRPLADWSGPAANLIMWRPSAAALEAARQAPISPVPPSYEQEQHLRSFRACADRNEDMPRMFAVVWDEPGRCELREMTHVLTAHLRRHDTYHSWFEERGGTIVRHALEDPAALQLEAVTIGAAGEADWQRQVLATPSPFTWDCFRFGILQRADGFTCFAVIDHIHLDSSIIAFLMEEIHTAYFALLDGEAPPHDAPAGRYLDYCTDQRQRAALMTLDDPGVAEWIAFLHRHNGRMPPFPLPLAVQEDRCLAEYLQADILDEADMAAFEDACRAAGARVIGGLLACAAITERELAGTSYYGVITPTTTRKTPEAFRTTGWCMGVVPIDFDSARGDFAKLAAAAQRSFDSRAPLAQIPIERVLDLAAGLPSIRPVATGGVMLSYMDTNLPPLSAHIARDWQAAGGRIYLNPGMAAQVALWFFRTPQGLTVTAAYTANATARSSMRRYADTLKDACRRACGQVRAAPAGPGARP
ncbi:condensation domain-containing protein [Aestuariivirga sp.]|jgi:hypothetical protein|uniref:condensation domain-containing protein n=1 Tax=Aestuariivirga sp. TaxID=2650926 RepID=UPI0037849182